MQGVNNKTVDNSTRKKYEELIHRDNAEKNPKPLIKHVLESPRMRHIARFKDKQYPPTTRGVNSEFALAVEEVRKFMKKENEPFKKWCGILGHLKRKPHWIYDIIKLCNEYSKLYGKPPQAYFWGLWRKSRGIMDKNGFKQQQFFHTTKR